jgi:hypothetical protein
VADQWYFRSVQGHRQFVDKVELRFRLSECVPKQHLYRRLAELLDWDFLYAQTQALYSHTGQPSLDPVVFFKLLLVNRLKNLVSDRQLMEHCSLRRTGFLLVRVVGPAAVYQKLCAGDKAGLVGRQK